MTSKLPQHPASAALVAIYPHWTLRLRRTFAQDRGAVWRALTDPEQIARWAPYRPDRNIATEGPVRLEPLDGSGEPLDGQVLDTVPDETLTYTWGSDQLRFGLSDDQDGVALTLGHNMDDRNSAASVAAGWHICLAALELLLAGKDVPSVVGENAMDHGWEDLQREYEAMFDEQNDESIPGDQTEE